MISQQMTFPDLYRVVELDILSGGFEASNKYQFEHQLLARIHTQIHIVRIHIIHILSVESVPR